MNFEPQLQVSYADKTFSADKRQIKYASHDREGHFDPYVGIKQMMDPEKYVDTGITLSTMHLQSANEDMD